MDKNFNVESFVSANGTVFLKLSHGGEVVGGGFFPLQFYKEFYGSLEIVLRKLIDTGLAEPLDHDLEQLPAAGDMQWN